MSDAFQTRLRRYADVIVHVGLNLRPGQRLLIAEPFELQGVSPDAKELVDAVSVAARAAGATEIGVIWGDTARVRAAAEAWPDREFDRVLAQNLARMREHVARGDALLFLQSSDPRLMDGVSSERVAALRKRCCEHYGQIAPHLVAGATNWTIAPAPTPGWACAVFGDSCGANCEVVEMLSRLWRVVFSACRVTTSGDPLAAWRAHLASLHAARNEWDGRRARELRLVGSGTDLAVALPADHVWCTASLATKSGHAFVANLPTEEIFTAPDRRSAEGTLRVARPIGYGGATIDGIELTFHRGRVVKARAGRGEELLRRMLATDDGASCLGEVAIVPGRSAVSREADFYFHPLLDENALNHVALGDGYPFTVRRADSRTLNGSLMHIDLPIEAEISIEQ